MADFKKVALSVGILILVPLFLFLFFDALYPSPEYNDFCKNEYTRVEKPVPAQCMAQTTQLECTARAGGAAGTQLFDCTNKGSVNQCPDVYQTADVSACMGSEGSPQFTTNNDCCQVYESCDYCSKNFNEATAKHNRNLFFILAPIGLLLIILGIYISIDYLAAGLMFAGLITLIWGTVIYFTEMSKFARAAVILVELLVIVWVGYKKIDGGTGMMGKKKPKRRR